MFYIIKLSINIYLLFFHSWNSTLMFYPLAGIIREELDCFWYIKKITCSKEIEEELEGREGGQFGQNTLYTCVEFSIL